MNEIPPELRYTYADYMSVTAAGDKRYELLDGDLFRLPNPTVKHQMILGDLALHLHNYVGISRLGHLVHAPLDVLIGEDVVQPDILFISHDRKPIIHEAAVKGAPDMIVEVLLLSTAERDLGYKRRLYANHEVSEYWIADPDAESIEVLTLVEARYVKFAKYGKFDILISPLFDKLSIHLEGIF